MKKLAIVTLSVFALTACHYGQEEAKNSLKRNEEYKNEKADYSVNRAGAGSTETPAEAPAPAAADTAATK